MWSYHWLAGHTHYKNKEQILVLPENPNTGINAHFFKKNYCAGRAEWEAFISNPNNQSEISSIYGGTQRNGDSESIDKDYADALLYASKHVPVIFCAESSTDPWYFLTNRTVTMTSDQTLTQNFINEFQDRHVNSHIEKFFNDSLTNFDKSVWDLRELIALNFDYFVPDSKYLNLIDRSADHLYIDSKDLWYNGEACLDRVFKYIDKKIVPERLSHWKKVYQEWQTIQLDILQFNWYLPIIVDSVVNNYNFDLNFLNLSLIQEAVIQGQLIKHHDLNLKCYGLEKFPNNTKDLHSLLEKNIHI
jgi:hypothetical protein